MRGKSLLGTSVAVVAFFLVFFVLGITGSAVAKDKVYKWRCQTHLPAASTSYKPSCEGLIKKLEERTNGRLKIELYPAGALIPAPDIFNAVQRGTIQMGMAAASYYIDKVPLANIGSGLPFNFNSTWEAAYFYRQLGFEEMIREQCAKYGVYYSTDKVIPTELCTTRPIKSFSDFKGLKVRSSGVSQLFLTQIGGAGLYLPGPEVYPALASGVVDGAHWGGIGGNYTVGLYEVAKYQFTPALNITGMETWLFNQKAIDQLPEDMQNIIYLTLEEHFWNLTNLNEFLEKEKLSLIQRDLGVKVVGPPDEEMAKVRAEAVKMWDKVAQMDPQCAKAIQILKDFHESMGRSLGSK